MVVSVNLTIHSHTVSFLKGGKGLSKIQFGLYLYVR